MRPAIRRSLVGAAVAALAVVAVPAACAVREYRRDPMPILDRGIAKIAIAQASESEATTATGERRRLLDLELSGVVPGPLRVTVSLPADSGGERLPVVLILGGLEAGRESLLYVAHHGANALVAVQYPRSPTYWYRGAPLLKLPSIREAVTAVPSQIASLAAWTRGQPWAVPERVSLLGYSFGAFFVPACDRVASANGIRFRALVVAYGGAEMERIFDANVQIRPRAAQWCAGRLLAAVVRPVEPAIHLPAVTTDTLLINGVRDRKIPIACARRAHALKPEPKTVIELDSEHMSPRDPALTARIVAMSREWLVGRGAMAP